MLCVTKTEGWKNIELPVTRVVDNFNFRTLANWQLVLFLGRRLKFEHGIIRSFSYNFIIRDNKGHLCDVGIPHDVVINQCPAYLFLPDPIGDSYDSEIAELFLAPLRKYLNVEATLPNSRTT